MAFIDCNFAKCALRDITFNLASKNGKLPSGGELERLKAFNAHFSNVAGLCFDLDFSSQKKQFYYINRKVRELLTKFNVRHFDKNKFSETFSSKSWNKLSLSKKKTHSLRDCKGCFSDYPDIVFPWNTRQFQHRNPLLHIPVHTVTENVRKSDKLSPEGITRLATKVYKDVNDSFEKVTGVTFGEVLPNVKEANLKKKPTKYERQKELDTVRKTVKRKLEYDLHAIDQSRPFQYRESLSSYEKITRNETLEVGPSKIRRISQSTKRHSSQKPSYNIDSVIEDLENLEPGAFVNWEKLAKKHGVTAQNAGQTLKEHLRDRNIDPSVYKNSVQRRSNVTYARRCKRRLFGGRISAPAHLTKKRVRNELKRKIESGFFDIGEPCVTTEIKRPRLYHGEIYWERARIEGRKIPLIKIRNQMLLEHENLGILRTKNENDYNVMDRATVTARLKSICEPFTDAADTDELIKLLQKVESTRHLKMWHDHSIIENHGYMLFVVSAVYDPALYYTNEEFIKKQGYHLDVETIVEQPWVYILGMSGDSSSDQFAFIDTRTSDLLDMNIPLSTSTGIQIYDVMRFHHGDHPALQFEFGVSQGGEYCCVGCPVSSRMLGDIAHCLRQPIRTLEDIRNTAVTGPHGRIPGLRKPVRSLKKSELMDELDARGLSTQGNCDELRESLKNTRCGVESVPALLIHTPLMSLNDLNIKQLEPVLTEGLHDCKGHIENILTELECKDHGDVATAVKELKDSLFRDHEKIRGKDYRKAAYLLPDLLIKRNTPACYIDLAKSLREICGLLYMRSVKRTIQSVLRLYNQILIHAILTREILGDPKKITKRKLFGVYFHGLLHAALLNRILAPRSGNAEFQEAEFHTLREITKRTSNHHADKVIPNMLVRRQAEKEAKGPVVTSETLEDLKTCEFGAENSVIKRVWLEQYPSVVQAHCEQIAEFLELGPGIWWTTTTEGNIEFRDSLGQASLDSVTPQQPCLHHFRSSTQAEEKKLLKLKWDSLIDRGVQLPLLKVRVYNEDGDLVRIDKGDLVFNTNALDPEEGNVEGIQIQDLIDASPTSYRDVPANPSSPRSSGIEGSVVTTCTNPTVRIPGYSDIAGSNVTTQPAGCVPGCSDIFGGNVTTDPAGCVPGCSDIVGGNVTTDADVCVPGCSDIVGGNVTTDPDVCVPGCSDVVRSNVTTDPDVCVPGCSDADGSNVTTNHTVSTLHSRDSFCEGNKCVTSEGKLLEKLFGPIPEIVQLDSFRMKAKSKDCKDRAVFCKKYLETLSYLYHCPDVCVPGCSDVVRSNVTTDPDVCVPGCSDADGSNVTTNHTVSTLHSRDSFCEGNKCVTSEGKLLEKLFGPKPEIVQLDSFRVKAKSKDCKDRAVFCKKYLETLSLIQTKVLKLHGDTKKAMNAFEKTYFVTHNKVPNKNNSPMTEMIFKLKVSETLLRSWKWGL